MRAPTETEWAVINIAVGVASGLLFHLFLGPRAEWGGTEGKDRLFVSLTAAIVIASGASYYLNLSPIYTNLILGFILANTGRAHQDARQLLAATERPMYLALLIFAGAAWAPTPADCCIWCRLRWAAAPRPAGRGPRGRHLQGPAALPLAELRAGAAGPGRAWGRPGA